MIKNRTFAEGSQTQLQTVHKTATERMGVRLKATIKIGRRQYMYTKNLKQKNAQFFCYVGFSVSDHIFGVEA